MTEQTSGERVVQQQAVEEAVAELERLKGLLQQAGLGEVKPSEVQQAVSDYVADHGDVFVMAATAVGEQVRSQLLSELYRWRAQLFQLRGGATPSPEGR